MRIQAAVLEGPGQPFRVQEVELQEPQAGEVLVQVKAVGVCHSDWHLVSGATRHPFPCVAGHEGSGVVAATGAGVTKLKVGDPVALNWAPSCGACFYCKAGRPALCAAYIGPIWAGTMLDGTTRLSRDGQPLYHYCGLACHAEYTVVPEVSCVLMPRELPFELSALIGCAVATGVGAVLNTAKVTPGSSVAVFGCGGVGLSAIMGAKVAGAGKIMAIDREEAKQVFALAAGATEFILAKSDVRSAIKELTEDRGVDCAIECVGARSVQELAFDCLRPGGTLVIAGLSPMGEDTNFPAARLVREEKTVMGSYYGTCDAARDFPDYAAKALAGALPLAKMVSRRYPLAQINEAYADMLSGKVARGILILGE
ncbi:MAG: Zn-dependent alcohol dehydrogenase [Armatimonadetes bacterium]|nr:Zn-dependent alcohol dehydrogenase [Armatimonadota bacterium]